VKRQRPKRKRAKVTGTLHGTVTVAAELRGTVKPPPGTVGGTVGGTVDDVTALVVGTTTPLIGVDKIDEPYDARAMTDGQRRWIVKAVARQQGVNARTKVTPELYFELNRVHNGNLSRMARAAGVSWQGMNKARKRYAGKR
jgi:hypothetical protein